MEQNTDESTTAKTGARAAPAKKVGRKAKAPAKKPTAPRKPRTSGKSVAKRGASRAGGKGSRETAKGQVIALLQRKDGATLPELCKAFGWQKHTVRGFISILGSNGHKIESTRVDGVRTYRIK